MNITQRQITFFTLRLQFAATLIFWLSQVFAGQFTDPLTRGAELGMVIYGGLLIAYRWGWEYARHASVALITLLVVIVLPEPFVSTYAPFLILLGPILALILVGPIWVVGSAVATIGLLLIRAGGVGVYASPTTWLSFAMLIAGLIISRVITETAQTRARHAETQIEYQAHLLENINDAVIAVDDQFHITAWNSAAESMYGWSAAEVMGRPSTEIIRSEITQAEREKILQHLREFGSYRSQLIQYHKNGQPIHVETNTIALYDEHRQPAGIVSVNRDVTERKHAEQALQRSQERFSKAFQASPAGLAISSLEDGRFMDVNESYLHMVEYEREEVIGHTSTELNLISLEERARYIQKFREQGRLLNFEMQLQAKSGRLVHMLFSSQQIELDGAVYLLSTTIDITERRLAEEQIQRQLKRLNALHVIDTAISSSFDVRVTLDIVLGQVISQLGVDATAILLFDLPNQTMEYATSQGFRSNVLQHTRLKLGEGPAGRAMREHLTIHIPDLLEAGGGLMDSPQWIKEGFVSYYGTPLIVKTEVKGVLEIYQRAPLHFDSELLDFMETLAGQAAIAVDNAQLFDNLQRTNDGLELHVERRTAELNQTNLELKQANRAKDAFLATMSHELRTPLNSILGLSETLLEQRRDPLSPYQQKSLEIITSSGHHLLELINDILDLSKIEAGKSDFNPQIFGVDELCRSSLLFVKEQAARKSITLTYQAEPAASKIFADPRRFKQILVNLLNNAVKFTPESGQVILQVQADAEQRRLRFAVIDNGIGIKIADLKLLFIPFSQVDSDLNREYEGTGLGLALAQRLADLHGGSVDVESEPGRGSRFTINLPWEPEPTAHPEVIEPGSQPTLEQHAQKSNPSAKASPGREIILLAEDNNSNILTIGDYLVNSGYQIVVAHDGLEAIKLAQEIQANIILMDIQMPRLDGLEAIRRLRADSRFASTPIIALTALAMPGDRERCLEAGANEYMSKPVGLKLLVQTIGNLLGHAP